jgi:hypothetical protein
MTPSHGILSLIEGLFLATFGWFLTRLSRFAPHSVCLSGQRGKDESESSTWYRFAIQNNEDICLTGRRKLAITILDEGKFLDGHYQKLFVGRNVVHAHIEDGHKVLTLEFDELPAYDTWSIECRTDTLARALSLSIRDLQEKQADPQDGEGKDPDTAGKLLTLPAVLSHTRLTLSRDRDSAFEGAAFTPEFRWVVVATLLIGLLPYSLYAYYRGFDRWDLAAVLGLALFGLGLWLAIRRRAPSITQGYWTGTTVKSDAVIAAAKSAGQ